MNISQEQSYPQPLKIICHNSHLEYSSMTSRNLMPIIVKGFTNTPDYESIGISKQSADLLECVRLGESFPVIDDIEEIVLESLCHYNMIEQLTKLKEQFSFITFDIVNDKIENFAIKHFRTKNAREQLCDN